MTTEKLKPFESAINRDSVLLVELPDGTQAERTAAEWWDHRHEWAMVGIITCTNRMEGATLPMFLLNAKMFDEAIGEAEKGDGTAYGWTAAELAAHRDDYLSGFMQPEGEA